ncbi:MAG: metallophosphoesterase family protein [Halieaceae bacterium]|jgi:hypothetical protein|nr:metallophosphoesterase family protein [Halieaceae bacterium]
MEFAKDWGKPGPHPDRILLNLTKEPATSISVTWRTDASVRQAYAEIAPATAAPKFWRQAETLPATTVPMDGRQVQKAGLLSHYHSVTFSDLVPDTLYAYRVGDGRVWSEWIQFRTAAAGPAPFTFMYVGDAQNNILEVWSRLIREGYRTAPNAAFIIHAGDLINDAHSESQWAEWFSAGGFIHRMLPSLPVAGNHEYDPYNAADEARDIERLSVQWRAQFTLPENGIDALPETNYYVDYQGVRIIVLNSNERQQAQAAWLREVLASNAQRWTVVTYHHPLFSASADRDNPLLRELWKPLFDEYGVDIALQGHDHAYARGHAAAPGGNLPTGLNTRDGTGTLYVVSVSGGKMYGLRPEGWDGWPATRDRAAENTQLFQILSIDGDRLTYAARTATGELYDAFDLVKDPDGGPNWLLERKQEAIAARRFSGTIPYQDELPTSIREALLEKFPGFTFDDILYVDERDFRGYHVELEKGDTEIDLKLNMDGRILEQTIETD